MKSLVSDLMPRLSALDGCLVVVVQYKGRGDEILYPPNRIQHL